ncbi:MAG: G-D-S-L family lipolytic protein, partial [Cyclobacteriaceae bacterium]|nr:G-D-S-L family lipolytic protein [Cyclobacteriaceae bacterium]
MNLRLLCCAIFLWSLSLPSLAQDSPFESEVRRLGAGIDSLGWVSGATVWTGSSTIRLWSSLAQDFPGKPSINTGFGGSKASDLEKYLFPLVIRFEPKEVFIYEGDNDLWADVPAHEILTSLKQIVARVHLVDPGTEIILIGAKPSPSRWKKKEAYLAFNHLLKEYCDRVEQVAYLDTWKALTDAQGNPRPELYLQDQLHLNSDGYLIWNGIFKSYFH